MPAGRRTDGRDGLPRLGCSPRSTSPAGQPPAPSARPGGTGLRPAGSRCTLVHPSSTRSGCTRRSATGYTARSRRALPAAGRRNSANEASRLSPPASHAIDATRQGRSHLSQSSAAPPGPCSPQTWTFAPHASRNPFPNKIACRSAPPSSRVQRTITMRLLRSKSITISRAPRVASRGSQPLGYRSKRRASTRLILTILSNSDQ